MSGLLFVPLPAVYLFGYFGICSGHLLIRLLKHSSEDINEQWRNLFGKNKSFEAEKQKSI